jgi:hypothetical protein
MVDEVWRVGAIGVRLDLLPELEQVLSIRFELDAPLPLARGADDPTAAAELLDGGFQPGPFVIVGDPSRHSELDHRRHVHQEASGQRDVGRQARALGADGVLDDLDEDLLAFAEEIADVRFDGFVGRRLVIDSEDVGEVVEDAASLADIEKTVPRETDVDERRLHSRQDPGHPTFVEVADHRRRPMALRPIADEARFFAQRNPGFEGVDREKENRVHH